MRLIWLTLGMLFWPLGLLAADAGVIINQYTPTTVSGGTSYADIEVYDDCDVTGTDTLEKGSGTSRADAGILAVAGVVGTAYDTNNDGYDDVKISTGAGNISVTEGIIGFYVNVQARETGTISPIWWGNDLTGPDFAFVYANSSDNYYFRYEDVTVTAVISTGSWKFVECAWNHNKDDGFCARTRVDNGAWATSNSCTGSAPTLNADISFGATDGNAIDMWVDQIIFGSDSTRDLYAIKALTSFPD